MLRAFMRKPLSQRCTAERECGLQALVLFSRLGVYLPLPGVDVKSFQQSVATGGGLLGYIDTLSGGSISRVGVFSLGRHLRSNVMKPLDAVMCILLTAQQSADGQSACHAGGATGGKARDPACFDHCTSHNQA